MNVDLGLVGPGIGRDCCGGQWGDKYELCYTEEHYRTYESQNIELGINVCSSASESLQKLLLASKMNVWSTQYRH